MHEKTEQKNIIYWILAIVVAFYSGSAVSVISSTYRNSIIYVAAFVVVIRVLEHGFRVSKSLRTVFLLLFSVMILITAIASNYSTFYLRIFATIYVAYEISEKVDGSILIDVYIKFMTFVTVLALAGYFAVNVLGLGDKLPKFTNLNDVAYRGILLFNYIERIPERNCALFWEPGLFATALTFALIFEMIYVNHKSIPRMILFVAGIITANSTAGYVMLALLFVLASLKIEPKQKLLKVLLSFIQIMVVIIAIVTFLNLDKILLASGLSQNEMFAKLMSGTLSESQRGRAVQDSFSLFLDSPIWGNGIVKISQSMNYIADTATSIYAMSIFGFLGCGYSLFFIVGGLKQRRVNLMTRVVLIIIILGILNKEPHIDMLFTWIFGFFLLKVAEEDRNESNGGNENVCI